MKKLELNLPPPRKMKKLELNLPPPRKIKKLELNLPPKISVFCRSCGTSMSRKTDKYCYSCRNKQKSRSISRIQSASSNERARCKNDVYATESWLQRTIGFIANLISIVKTIMSWW